MNNSENKDSGSRKRPFLEDGEENTSEKDIENIDFDNTTDTTTVLQRRLASLEKDVNGRYGLEDRLAELEGLVADLTSDILETKAENRRMKNEMKLIQAVVIRKDKEIEELRAKMIDQKARDMQNNILLHNISEQPNEDCESLFRNFLWSDLQMETGKVSALKIERAHRVGVQRTNKSPRPIVARFLSYKEKEMVLQAWYEKADKNQNQQQKDKQRLTKQLPPEYLQKRAQNYQLLDNVKAKVPKGEEVKYRFQGDTLYINNQLTKPQVKKTSVEDVFRVDPDDIAIAQKLPQGQSKQLTDRGSTFSAHAFKTTNINEVRKAYKLVTSNPKHAQATHNILVYSINNELGWEDDNEFGARRILTKWLEKLEIDNITIVITRQYGGTHPGTQRFENLQTVSKEALDNIQVP